MEGFKEQRVHIEGIRIAPFHVGAVDDEPFNSPRQSHPDPQKAIALAAAIHPDGETHLNGCAGGEPEIFGKGKALSVFIRLVFVIHVRLSASILAPHEAYGKAVDSIGASAAANVLRSAAEAREFTTFYEFKVLAEAQRVDELN